LTLCVKLRKQLEETRNRLRLIESQSTKPPPSYTNSSSMPNNPFYLNNLFYLEYRSRQVDSSNRLPTRSRSFYTNTYNSPRRSSVYTYSKYDHEDDLDYILPSRYLSLISNNRYGSYSTYRY
jgi:hypothetical protein